MLVSVYYACLLTYLLHAVRFLLEKLTGSQLVKKFNVFYVTQSFMTAFVCARHLSLSRASLIQSIPPHRTSWRSIFMLSSHLCLGLPSGLFLSGFPTKTLYKHLLYPIRATCPAHLIVSLTLILLMWRIRWAPSNTSKWHMEFNLVFKGLITQTILGEQYRSLSSSLCSVLHSPVTLSLLDPNISLNVLFSNALRRRS